MNKGFIITITHRNQPTNILTSLNYYEYYNDYIIYILYIYIYIYIYISLYIFTNIIMLVFYLHNDINMLASFYRNSSFIQY